MPRTTNLVSLAASCLCVAAVAWADPPARLDARVEQVRNEVGVPGLAVAIVEDGRTTLARGYGVRRLGTDDRVDADTLFQIGSIGKAFTAAALAVLVDRGRIAWDDPVTRHVPYFEMFDPWVTREMTVLDLLVHRSGLGLGAGDLLFVPRTRRSRADIVRALRHIEPATSFRGGYAYDNVLYIVAGPNSYALGWVERDYRGHRLIMHSGAVFGAQAILILIPELDVGFSVMINSEDGEALLGLAYELLDHYLDRPYQDWGAAWQTFVRQRDERAVARLETETASPAPVGPSLPLERYAGRYVDAWYGPVDVSHGDGGLAIDFTLTPGMDGALSHWQYDTFRVDWRDRLIEPAYVTFALDADGRIDRIGMRPVSPMADFSFNYRDLDLRPAAEE